MFTWQKFVWNIVKNKIKLENNSAKDDTANLYILYKDVAKLNSLPNTPIFHVSHYYIKIKLNFKLFFVQY